nr:DUF928 domain-containing protein [Petrachloros mirabilis]
MNTRILAPVLTSTLVVGALSAFFPMWASYTPPPQLSGKAGNREGAATRTGRCQADMSPPLTTLVPVNHAGWTAAEYPTVYWFTPENTFNYLRFTLAQAISPTEEVALYSTSFRITGKAGISRLTLPAHATLPPLETGKDYRWMVELVCDPNEPSGNQVADGWLQYVRASPSLMAQVESARPEQRHEVYAQAGYWYDALRELAILRESNPTNDTLSRAWQDLLKNENVRLETVSDQQIARP